MKAKHAIGFIGHAFEVLGTAMTSGEVYVEDKVREERQKICDTNACQKLSEGRCIECGCPIIEKVKYKISKCPEGFWINKK